MKKFSVVAVVIATVVGLSASTVGCGKSADDTSGNQASGGSDLSAEELEKGIGPIKSVELTAIDPSLAAQGEQIFTTKCSACHKLAERYVGPPLGSVLSRRSPEFVMNMMLNPDEMVRRHPEVKALLAQFLTPMPNQNLTEQDARAVLEYLRANADQGS